ncbi:MAG: YtxH domain-containing protein [Bacillus sp. (in: firmicutes)]
MNSNEYQKELSRDSAKYDSCQESVNSKDFMIGALIGGIVGAATALFLAPKSGKELRSDLNDGAKLLSEKTEKIRQTAMEKGADFAEAAKTKTSTLGETVSKQTASLKETVSKQAASMKENVKNMQQGKEEPKKVIENMAMDAKDAAKDVAASIDKDEIKQKLQEAEQDMTETENKMKK